MKKRVFFISLAASLIIGVVVAWAVLASKPSADNFATYDQPRREGTTLSTNSYSEHSDADTIFAYSDSTRSTSSYRLPDFTTAAEMGVKSVVNIDVVKRVAVNRYSQEQIDLFEYFFGNPGSSQQRNQTPQYHEQRGGGSGVIISEDGYIISNNHVVEDADQIKVTTNDGDMYEAKIVGTDPATDVALLKIEPKENLTPIVFGNSDNIRLGEWVLAIGNPYGLTSTVTQGIISAKGRSMGVSQYSRLEIESFIQTDAVVNPGNSGGALLTLDGRLIGINTMIYSRTGSYSGYSFAIPSSIVKKVASDLRQYGVVQRALLGVMMNEITAEWIEQYGKEHNISERGGIYIAEVQPNSAAEDAGIKKGDILIEINGMKMNKMSAVQETISRLRPNDKIDITIKRDGKVKHFDVTLRNSSGGTDIVTKKSFDLAKELGATFAPIPKELKDKLKIEHGIQVTSIQPDGLLARLRVKRGFIITSINDIAVTRESRLDTINIEKIETIEGIYPDGSKVIYSSMER